MNVRITLAPAGVVQDENEDFSSFPGILFASRKYKLIISIEEQQQQLSLAPAVASTSTSENTAATNDNVIVVVKCINADTGMEVFSSKRPGEPVIDGTTTFQRERHDREHSTVALKFTDITSHHGRAPFAITVRVYANETDYHNAGPSLAFVQSPAFIVQARKPSTKEDRSSPMSRGNSSSSSKVTPSQPAKSTKPTKKKTTKSTRGAEYRSMLFQMDVSSPGGASTSAQGGSGGSGNSTPQSSHQLLDPSNSMISSPTSSTSDSPPISLRGIPSMSPNALQQPVITDTEMHTTSFNPNYPTNMAHLTALQQQLQLQHSPYAFTIPSLAQHPHMIQGMHIPQQLVFGSHTQPQPQIPIIQTPKLLLQDSSSPNPNYQAALTTLVDDIYQFFTKNVSSAGEYRNAIEAIMVALACQNNHGVTGMQL